MTRCSRIGKLSTRPIPKDPVRRRPRLEAGEDRLAPATFLVPNRGDNGGFDPAVGAPKSDRTDSATRPGTGSRNR